MVDAGHGGPPTKGFNYGAAGFGVEEKSVVLSVALEMRNLFPDSVRLTRSTDTLLGLSERAGIANRAGADVFVSLHCNGYEPRPDARGWEIFHASGSGVGESLCQKIHNSVFPVFPEGWPNRGIKSANYSVLTNTTMPAALLEFGFLTNRQDAEWLSHKVNQIALAQAIGEGLGLSRSQAPENPEEQESPAKLVEKIQKELNHLASLISKPTNLS